MHKRHAAQWQWQLPHVDRRFGSDRVRRAAERDGGVAGRLPARAGELEQIGRESSTYGIYE